METLLKIDMHRDNNKVTSYCGVYLERDTVMWGKTFVPILELKGDASLTDKDFHFVTGEGGSMIISHKDAPFALLIEMDPETRITCQGKLKLSVAAV